MKTGTCILTFVVLVLSSLPQSARAQEATQPKPNVSSREGQHDFDFNFGVWKTHIKRVLEPLSGSNKSIELNGLVTTHKIWDGRAQWEEIEADGPNGHWQGMTLFLYNPQAHQWNQSFINSKIGELSPPLVGEFKDGRGELFSQDTFNGRSVLVRAVWSNIEPDSHHFEESYSDDGGKTWAPAFIAELAREKSAPVASTPTTNSDANQTDKARDGAHDFDFDFGTWKTHSSRMLHPLTGSKDWAEMDGVTVVKKVWGGRANLAEYKAEGPAGQVELMALRWYNPRTHQWNIDFATPKSGALGNTPGVGEFKNGRGDFYDQESINGKTILVRFSIWGLTPDRAQSEQAFSDDGGKTWETNWVNKYTRIPSDPPTSSQRPSQEKSEVGEVHDSRGGTVSAGDSRHDFDFFMGNWRVHHRRLKERLANNHEWVEFEGTCTGQKILGGLGNIGDCVLDLPGGAYRGVALRAYDPEKKQWSIWWLDGRSPGQVDVPAVGRFENGVGTFYADDTLKGKPIRVRYLWTRVTSNTPHWEQAFSADAGETWETNWTWDFTKVP